MTQVIKDIKEGRKIMKFQSKTKIGIFIGAVVILLVIGVLFFCIAKPSTS